MILTSSEGHGGRVATNLQGTQQALKFQTTVATLDHKLEHRPTPQDLADHNIFKSVPTNLIGIHL